MAPYGTYKPGTVITRITSANLTGKAGYLATVNGSAVSLASGATLPLFVLEEEANGSVIPEAVNLIASGTARVRLGTGGATNGAALTADTDGRAIVTTTPGAHVIGYALEAGNANDTIEVLVTQSRLYIV